LFVNAPQQAIYFSGDIVWYQGVAEVAKRFPLCAALLNLAAARVPQVGSFYLTMNASEAAQAANVFANACLIPLHFEGWAHFLEGREEMAAAFADASRLRWPELGRVVAIDL
jgi:L-ascorbate metabolism protein UlaG (beta-lactamase superfamily)